MFYELAMKINLLSFTNYSQNKISQNTKANTFSNPYKLCRDEVCFSGKRDEIRANNASNETTPLTSPESVLSSVKLAKMLGFSDENPVNLWIKNGKLICEHNQSPASTAKIINTARKENAEFLNELKEKLPNIYRIDDFSEKFNLPKNAIKTLTQKGELRPFGVEDCKDSFSVGYVYDSEDELNKMTLERHKKLHPMPSEKYFKYDYTKIDKLLVPVKYLSELGFGEPKQMIDMIRNGKLKGACITKDTPQGRKLFAVVDVAQYFGAEEKLKAMREDNEALTDVPSLAKELGIRKKDVEEAILNDELEIVKEFIFPEDAQVSYINLKNPKNQAFVDKVMFEREILNNIKTENTLKQREKFAQWVRAFGPEQSVKMQIVWKLCPSTKLIASERAKGDGYLSNIFTKLDNEEELMPNEEAKLASYRKGFWNAAGTKEYTQAGKIAKEYIEAYKAQGLEAIDDPEIRKIFEENMGRF